MPDESMPQSAQSLERRLATILCADVAGYSRIMADDEERTVRVFRGHREIFESLVNLHRGRIFNTAGDALLAEFNSAVEAVRCATEIQAALRTRNDHLAPEEQMQFRIGINLGDVIIQDGDLLGDGVNVAARIQTATAPGGICISGSVHDQIRNKLSLNFKLLGEQTYKNIPQPIRTYTINEGATVTAPARRTGWRMAAAIAAAVLAITGAGTWGYRQYDAHRAEQLRTDASLAAQLTAQKLATEQAQQAAEEAKREAQKLAGEEGLRRVREERNRVEQDRKQLEAERRAAEAVKRLTVEEDLRRAQEERGRLGQERLRLDTEKQAAEAAKRQAAEEDLRRAQERSQLEQERARLEADRQAAEAARKQSEASQRAAAAKEAAHLAAPHDGAYNGRLCNQIPDKAPVCWPVALAVQSGNAEGSWISSTKKTAQARGTVAADGSVQLILAAWAPNGTAVEATLLGRIADGAITASGRWKTGGSVDGRWKRAQAAAAAPAVKDAPNPAAPHDGAYNGRLCNQFPDKAPSCWPVALAVQGGIAEGRWITGTKKTARVRGTVAADGPVRLNLTSWSPKGAPAEAALLGRIADGAITASGQWKNGGGVDGRWKRVP